MTDDVGQAALDRALDQKDLLLVYQPIHDAATRRIVSAEALLRQRRRSGELREASIITDAAERGPELFTLDSWLVRTAFRDATRWQRHGHVKLNINLSPREFEEGNIARSLSGLARHCGIDPHQINLEITETKDIDQPEKTKEILQGLKALGFGLWLDDFGTGHSSMTHLRHFPLDGLKIAGSFIAGVENDERCRAIVRALIALAHELHMAVIAEEVERESQLQFVTDAGCEYVQGFLLSRPMPVEELGVILSREAGEGSPDSGDPSLRSG